jgi:hypothetical protein
VLAIFCFRANTHFAGKKKLGTQLLLNKTHKTKLNMMMYKRITQTALILLLTIGSSFAVMNDLEDKLAEDKSFWGRELQGAFSLKTEVKTTAAGTENEPTSGVDRGRRTEAYTRGGAHSQ